MRPDAGQFLIRGESRDVHSPADGRRAGLVSVYQEPSLIPDLDVAANLRLTQTPVEPFLAWVKELGIQNLDLRETARNIPLAVLRVLDLARALAIEPDILLLDEMTAALPADLDEKVLDVVRRRARTGRSVIFISHRFLEISALCDRATVLRDGETVGVVTMEAGAEEKIVELMLGAPVEKPRAAVAASVAAAAPEAADGTPRLGVRNVSVGARLVDVSFDLHAGEVLGVVALEGQGQEELFGVGSGSARPSGGRVAVDGQDVRFCERNDRRRDSPELARPGHEQVGYPSRSCSSRISLVMCRGCHVDPRFGNARGSPAPAGRRSARRRAQARGAVMSRPACGL